MDQEMSCLPSCWCARSIVRSSRPWFITGTRRPSNAQRKTHILPIELRSKKTSEFNLDIPTPIPFSTSIFTSCQFLYFNCLPLNSTLKSGPQTTQDPTHQTTDKNLAAQGRSFWVPGSRDPAWLAPRPPRPRWRRWRTSESQSWRDKVVENVGK